jgi:hypothetical protein
VSCGNLKLPANPMNGDFPMTGRHAAAKRPRRETETSDYVAFMTRAMVAWGDRIAADPAALVHMRELTATLADQTNRGIWEANRRGRYSEREMAAILGVSHQAVHKRVHLGELVAAAVTAARGGGALIRLAEVRARRARLLEAAGVEDRTGSERERTLRAV